ncbi:MAG: hypothetical protein EPGJADBJ_02076 [Saprospiraceae bacterium]|nr:hypothetical protein [Saprospiraceae bacterium]
MPKHKHPLARLQRINDIFQTRSSAQSVVKAEALAEELGISLRQLRTDMEVLRDKGAPLEYDPVLKGWRYTPGQYFTILDNLPLTGEDLACLRIAVETLAKVNHLKNFEQLPAVFGKIHRAAKKWMGGSGKVVGKSVYFDPLPRYDGGKHLPFFLEAIESFRRVEFQYQPFHADAPKTVVFDPWFLRHYDRRWYVGGFSHDPAEQFVRVFPLERIEGQPEIIGYFHDKPPDYDAGSYWRYIYGITVPPKGRVEGVMLEFTPLQGKYFLSSPFFEPFNVVESSPERLVIGLNLIINIDLERKLASFGADVRVLAPESLAATMRRFFEKALKRYA